MQFLVDGFKLILNQRLIVFAVYKSRVCRFANFDTMNSTISRVSFTTLTLCHELHCVIEAPSLFLEKTMLTGTALPVS